MFDAADWRSPEEREEGGRVFAVERRDGRLELRFGNRRDRLSPRIRRGDLVWRTHDPELDRAARPYIDATAPVRRQPVARAGVAREGEPLTTQWTVGRTMRRRSGRRNRWDARKNRGLDEEHLRAQFGRLGQHAIRARGAGARRSRGRHSPRVIAAESIEAGGGGAAASGSVRSRTVAFRRVAVCSRKASTAKAAAAVSLHLLVRTPEQLDAAIDLRPATITLDYLDLYGLKPSIERVRAAGLAPRVASPRVLKPGEERIVDFLLSCGCPILVRSTGLLHALRERPHAELAGDFSLNAANALTAAELFDLGLDVLTPTHDLNAAQVADLARDSGADRIEAIIYQHLPVFHTEHCVFCRFLSTGTSYRDCGRPCEEHRVALRDDAGRAHPVMADVGCRNTVFGAEAQEASRHLAEWREAGISRFRLEFAHETADQVARVTRAFEDALGGRCSSRELANRLQKLTPQGITEGSLFVPEGYRALPILQ